MAFNAEEDAKTLRAAMKGLGTDEAAIIKVVANRSLAQRLEIKKTFKTSFGRDLIADLKDELSGNFEDAILALFQTAAEYDADSLHKAMKGAGTDESTLIEILASRNNAQITAIKAAYKAAHKKELEDAVISETSGDFKKFLVGLLQANRSEAATADAAKAAADAKDIHEAGVARWGTDESTFRRVLALRSAAELSAINAAYHKLAGHTLIDAIKNEFSGDAKTAMVSVVEALTSPDEYFAKRVHDAVAGLGTKDTQLIRVIVTRDEVNMPGIKAAYKKLYGKDMVQAIKDDTSGDYKKLLVELVSH
eukprot:Colp12_sorted_trinity150504_noHs@4332